MMTLPREGTKLDFTKQDIFIGMDISKKSWKVCIYVGPHFHRSFSQPPKPEILIEYLKTHFPGGAYHCVYEAGYFGFWIHRALTAQGIECLVVNPADVPTANWEKGRKTDRVDANKLARSLSSGSRDQIRPIYVPDRHEQEDRALVRLRTKLVQHQTRCKNRIKAFLQYYGFPMPPEDTSETHWSRRYLAWLEGLQMEHETGTYVFRSMLDDLCTVRAKLAQVTRQIRLLASHDRYREMIDLLCTVPGVSHLTAMTILTELCSIHRFKTLDQLASYVGLVPGEYSSGERQVMTGMTYRKNPALRYVIMESAWMAIRQDPALMMSFSQWALKMPKTKAVVKIARKLLNRIRFVLTHRQPYVIGIVPET